MESGQIDINATLQDALGAYEQQNLPLTGALCEIVLEQGHRPPLALTLLGLVAMHVKEFKRAADLLREANSLTPGDVHLKQHLDMAKKLAREQALQRPDGRKRFLVIKPWGYGFCSDLDHVLGCLLLSELTGRTPIVHWGAGSRFRDATDDNAWPRFFEPVSKASLADLFGKGHSWFPPKWSDGNIGEPEVNKMEGNYSRMAGIFFLNQRDDVTVSDMHVPLVEMATWIRAGSPLAGRTPPQLYRDLVKKYLRPAQTISSQVDAFAAAHFAGKAVIAAHVRGSDKLIEDARLIEKNQETQATVSAFLAARPDSRAFLLTDDEQVRRSFAERFGDRLITTDCLRTSTAKGLHYTDQPSRSRLGEEVVVDMYLAARCDQFVGVGTSNVAAMIEHLKDWAPGALTIHDHSIHYHRNPFLHRWTLAPEAVKHLQDIDAAQRQREQATQHP